MVNNPEGNRHFGSPHMRWKDVMRRDVESLNEESDWKAEQLTERIGCVTIVGNRLLLLGSYWPLTLKKKTKKIS